MSDCIPDMCTAGSFKYMMSRDVQRYVCPNLYVVAHVSLSIYCDSQMLLHEIGTEGPSGVRLASRYDIDL